MSVEPSQRDLADQAPPAAEPQQAPQPAGDETAPQPADDETPPTGADAPEASADDETPEASADDETRQPTDGDAAQPATDDAAQPATDDARPAEADAPQPADDEAAQPAETDEAQPAEADAPQPSADHGHAPRRLRLPALLGVVTVLLGGFGAWASVQAHNERAANAQQNLALTNGAATSTVRHQVSSAIQAIFSYSYSDTAKTRRDAQNLLTGPAIRQYDQLFSLVQKDAPAQKLVVTTSVTNTGVEFLTGSRARVLIFANQQDSRAGTGQTSYAGAMFAVTAVLTGNTWKISNIDTFTGG
jgi:Mce-associated membrane protein